jgi:hypothetical protein
MTITGNATSVGQFHFAELLKRGAVLNSQRLSVLKSHIGHQVMSASSRG